ncbi:unnamed protein product [Cladocopium goreaui]|uniref:Guanylate-binding protein 7 n=1 Tax=Cladocopium goreaui TaxID=2562237 RepID=A0A9P1CK99_9DINO|nr:unnamed protein product [Cladocopium goreaui]
MPIAEKTIRSLKLVNKNLEEVDLLLLRWPAEGDVWMLALPCRVSRGGLILAVPGNGIPDEDLSQGQEASPEDILGPSLHVTISLQAEESLGDAVEVLLLEFTMGIRQQLERKAPRTRRPYLRFAEAQQLPDMAELDDAVDEWVTSGSLRDADWQTALEEEENPAPQADLKAVVAVLAKLEKRVEELQKHPNLQTVKTPAPQRKATAKTQAAPPQIDGPNDKDMAEILRAMREEVGSRPERIADEPASRITAQDCINLVVPDMAQSSSGPSVDDMMKISMLKLMKEMQAKGSRKNKKLPGLVGTNGSSSEEEGETWSSTSRGGKAIEAVEKLRYAMKQNPGAYLERMEARMQRAVGAEEMGPLIPEKFIRSVPVGRSRTAGYALSGFATIHKLMLEGKQRHARLHCVRMISAMEQFLLDESWGVASRLTGVEEPPWSHWASQDLASIRKQYIYTRLMDATWIGAIINELKEEEWSSFRARLLSLGVVIKVLFKDVLAEELLGRWSAWALLSLDAASGYQQLGAAFAATKALPVVADRLSLPDKVENFDPRALPDSFLYCVDASPSGAGVCRAEVGVEVSGELWRRGDKVGYRMPLLSRLQSSLKGSGWDEEAVLSEEESTGDEGRGSASVGQMHGSLEVVFEHRVMLADPSLALFEFPFDLLEVYAGGAQMSHAWKAKGFKVLPPLEVKQGWDLLDPELFFGLLSFVRAGKVRFLWWAPPGATFSSSQAARVRSAEAPWGLDVLADCVVKGNLHACQCALLALVQVTLGLFMAGEVAATSLIRALGAWRVLSRRENVFEVLFDWCRFGRKNLHVASIHFPTWSLRADGPSRGRKVLGARTPLPKWFWALRQGSRQAASKLDGLQGLSRALNRWITERTRSIRQGLLNKLETWLAEQLPDTSLELLARHHIDVLSEWLEEYMVTLYLEGASRRSAAESLNAVVQQFGWLRSSLAAPWNVLKTWDMLEPVTHHPPMPLQVVLALASTALAWNWPHFAALLVIGYFGLLRPSELVGLRRRDLSLPQDHWEPQVLYVRIGQPKTRFRAAMAQHVRIDETGVAAWVQLILGSMPMWRKLWCGSVSSFKTRLELVQQAARHTRSNAPEPARP